MSGFFSSSTDKFLVVALAIGGGLYTAQPQFPSNSGDVAVEEQVAEPEVVAPEVETPELPPLVAPTIDGITLDVNGLSIAGTAAAGAGVALSAASGVLAETTADEAGNYALNFAGDLPEGDLSLVSQFPDSDEVMTTTVTLPEPPVELVAPEISALDFNENGVVIGGVATKSAALVLRDANGTVLVETTTDEIGAFELTYDGEIPAEGMDAVIASIAENGEEVTTNVSLMPPAPEVVLVAPEITTSEVTETSAMIAGTAAVGSMIELRDAAGAILATSDVGEDGGFAFEYQHALPEEGAEVVIASKAPSGEEMTTALMLTPPAPEIEPVAPVIGEVVTADDGVTKIMGSAVAGSMVELRDAAGAVLASGETSEDGAYELRLAELPETGVNGQLVNVVPSGAEMATPIEILPPEPEVIFSAPLIEEAQIDEDGFFTGKGVAEGAKTVELRNAEGAVVTSFDVGDDGVFTLLSAQPLEPGVLTGSIVAIDENGEELETAVEIDVPERLPPVVEPSVEEVSYNDTGAMIKGAATAGTNVELRLPSGNVVASAPVDDAGMFSLAVNADIPATGMVGTLVSVNEAGDEAVAPLELMPPVVEPEPEEMSATDEAVEEITIGLETYQGAANEPVVLQGVTVPGSTVEFIIDGQNVGSVEAGEDGAYVGRVDGIPAGQYPVIIRSTTGETSADINSLLEVDKAEAVLNEAETTVTIMRNVDEAAEAEAAEEAVEESTTETETETEAETEAEAAAEAEATAEEMSAETEETASSEDMNAASAGDISNVESVLDGDALEKYRALPAITSVGGEYVVKEGDSLEGISNALYGSIDYWPAIYALNAEEIGEDPHKIFPGQTLKMP